MVHVKNHTSTQPRWKAICRQLEAELARFDYGSRFHTIAEVCERFEVSTTTAIRALTELANAGLIEKIQGRGNVVRHVAKETHVRLIVPDRAPASFPTFDPVIKRLLDGVTEAARQRRVDFNMVRQQDIGRLFPHNENRHGFLILRGIDKQTHHFLRAEQFPHVFIDPLDGYRRCPHARTDRVAAGFAATQHLLDMGHRRIAWITGPLDLRNFRERLKGSRSALLEAGLKFSWSLVKCSDGNGVQEAEALDELMNLRRPPTAVIAGDDYRAMHILDACAERGISVPDQLSVMGFPGYPEASLTTPPLSVVDARYEQVGVACLNFLLEQMHGRANSNAQQEIIQPRVIARSSTGSAPIKRPTL